MTDEQLTAAIEAHFRVTVHNYAEMDTIDSWLEQDGRMVAYCERKCRNVTRDAYPTAVVDDRKWTGLLAAEFATGLPSILAYAWSDGSWGHIRPSRMPQLTLRVLAPGPEAVSLNAGVSRPVVDIPIDAFEMHTATARGAA